MIDSLFQIEQRIEGKRRNIEQLENKLQAKAQAAKRAQPALEYCDQKLKRISKPTTEAQEDRDQRQEAVDKAVAEKKAVEVELADNRDQLAELEEAVHQYRYRGGY